jgi:hypothetical protein
MKEEHTMDLTLAQLDRDGALVEAVEQLSSSRADLLRSGAVGGGALLGLLVVPAAATAAGARDTDILNFALCLEYLQAAFYKDAVMMKKLSGEPAQAARMVGAVEQAHVAAYRNLLGSKALARPRFNFHGTTESQTKFLRTAIALEDLAVAAYKAQIPLLTARPVIAAAVSIHSVEARHAAWMRRLLGVVPARAPFDDAEGRQAVNRTLASTGFITQKKPRMIAQRGPRFTG